MKTVLSILFLACVLATNAQQTQVKAYSLEEMKAGFISQYVNHEPEPSLSGYDEIWFDSQLYATYGDEKDSIDPYYANKIKSLTRIMESDPSLRVVKNKVLPLQFIYGPMVRVKKTGCYIGWSLLMGTVYRSKSKCRNGFMNNLEQLC